MSYFHNIRFYVLCISVLWALAVFLFVVLTIPTGQLQIIRLTQIYALTAITYIYVALMATPLTRTFTFLPFRGTYIKARRAIGFSAFFFALIHATLAFFWQLGGFPGLFFLSGKYLLAISLSFTALVILSAMASTSFDYMVDKLSFTRWKMIHRFVYLAAVLIIIHALMLGTHFQDLSAIIPQIAFSALAILLILEARRFDNYLQAKFLNVPRFGLSLVIVLAAVLTYLVFSFAPSGAAGPISLGIHAQHIQLAQQAQQAAQSGAVGKSNIPALQGNPTLRFNVEFDHPDPVQFNQDTPLGFKVFYASNGAPELLFSRVYEKPMHLIVVDDNLTYFDHIHPSQADDTFNITTKFPYSGKYHLYVDFQPLGAIEQQFAFELLVYGNNANPIPKPRPDQNLTKDFGNFTVTLDYPKPLSATQMSIGKQKLSFTIKDKTTGQPTTNLKPYLAAFGHLVMIDVDDYQYLHVHPTNLVAPAPNASGGPLVEFIPLGLYKPINAGVYRVFAQFNPDGKLFTADYTIEVGP